MNLKKYSNDKSIFFVPIETKVREFHAKLLFSLIAAEAGFNVILGGQRALREQLHLFPRGIYIDKSVAFTKIKWFRRFRLLGNVVTAWDEEGLIIYESNYVNRRFSREAFDQIKLFFAWGSAQAETIFQKRPEIKEKVMITGNPRFDMLRPEIRGFYSFAVKELRQKYSPMILINTSFGLFNHFKGINEGIKIHKKAALSLNASFFEGWKEFQKLNFLWFAKMLPDLSRAFPDHMIVIRPHPSEKHEVWRDLTKGLANISVIHEGNVIEWMLSAEAVIHSNCTTGVEAFMLDVPVIAYRPVTSDIYETYLPNALSIHVFSAEELIDKLKNIVKAKSNFSSMNNYAQRIETAKKYIANVDGLLASERIVNALRKVSNQFKQSDNTFAERAIRIGAKYFIGTQTIIRRFLEGSNSDIGYNKQKFPGLDYSEIQQAHDRLKVVSGRFSGIKVMPVGKSCFKISSVY